MNLTDELRKLAALRQEGHLTDAEFTEAKRRLLTGGPDIPTNATVRPPVREEVSTAPVSPPEFEEATYRSSRWSSGNLFFPDSLTLARDGMLFRKGALIGSNEEHVAYESVASFRINNGFFLSDITIETSGGSQPIFVNGLWKGDARAIQDTIRAFQRRGT